MTYCLHPFRLPTEENTLDILIIGQDMYSFSLGKAINDCRLSPSDDMKTRAHVIECLTPTNMRDMSERKIDFLVFLLDPQNANCIKDTERQMQYLDVNYFLGRACFVNIVTGAGDHLKSVALHDIQTLADKYQLYLHAENLKDSEGSRRVAEKIVRQAAVAAGFMPHVWPLHADFSKRYPQVAKDASKAE